MGVSVHRPLAYSTLADLVHHVRQHLPLSDLSLAVQLFAKNIDDESLPSSIQTMSCKLLLNLVDCIRSKSEQESGNGRDVLMRMLEVLPLLGGFLPLISQCTLQQVSPLCQPGWSVLPGRVAELSGKDTQTCFGGIFSGEKCYWNCGKAHC